MPPGEPCGWGPGRGPPPKGVSWPLRASSSGPEVGLPKALPPTPRHPPPHPKQSFQSLEAKQSCALGHRLPAPGAEGEARRTGVR